MSMISPGFAMLTPVVQDADLMPRDIRRELAWLWHQLWCPERTIALTPRAGVTEAGEGLVLVDGTELLLPGPGLMAGSFLRFLAGHCGPIVRKIRCRSIGTAHGPNVWDIGLKLPPPHLARLPDPEPLPPPADPQPPPASSRARLDAAFDRHRTPDVAAAGVDPPRHFVEAGWREGREPSAGLRIFPPGQDINPLARTVLQADGREVPR